jgi:GNAT superfamily N-acetyltransferase
MKVSLVETTESLQGAAKILLHLRLHYSLETLITQIEKQQTQGYQLVMAELDGKPACVAGFIYGENLAWGKFLYVDDLVTAEDCRSKGAGKAIIDWLKQHAQEAGCKELHLDSGVQRKDAHRFYEREGMIATGLHFAVTDLSA